MTALPRVRSGLLKHPLDNQVLVYDPRTDQVHLLDPTTACVLDLLEEGGWTPEGMTSEISARLGVESNPAFLSLALGELERIGIVDAQAQVDAPAIDVKRRELLRTIAVAGAATMLVPAVATLTATRGYGQSTSGHGAGTGCASNAQCVSGVCGADLICKGANGTNCGTSNAACQSNFCNPATGQCAAAALLADGAACTTGPQCQNGKCCNGKCRPSACTTSSATGSCTGATVPPGNAAVGADPACCSGFCERQGNSTNYNCQPSTCT